MFSTIFCSVSIQTGTQIATDDVLDPFPSADKLKIYIGAKSTNRILLRVWSAGRPAGRLARRTSPVAMSRNCNLKRYLRLIRARGFPEPFRPDDRAEPTFHLFPNGHLRFNRFIQQLLKNFGLELIVAQLETRMFRICVRS